MYSSMHPLGEAVNRVERTLLNFFSRRCVRGGCFGVPGRCFAGDFGAAARREWAVLPRNSAVFEWREGAARLFSTRQTLPGGRGEKIFKNFLERGGKSKNWGAGGAGRWVGDALYRVYGAIFRRWRGENGRFYRGIPGFSVWARVRRGDSAHGGRCRAS